MADDHRQTDEHLRERAELFRFIVESASDYAIFTTDPERRVTSWNLGAERLIGWPEAEIVGQEYLANGSTLSAVVSAVVHSQIFRTILTSPGGAP